MEKSPEKKFLWGKERPGQFDPDYYKQASRMYQEGDKIVISAESYDREEHRQYEYEGVFSLVDCREAFAKLSAGDGGVTIKGLTDETLKITQNDNKTFCLALSCSAAGPSSFCGANCHFSEIKKETIKPLLAKG
jgi:hypothetical protein